MIFRWLLLALCVGCQIQETRRNPHQNLVPLEVQNAPLRSSCQETFVGKLSPLCQVDALSASEAINLIFSKELTLNPELFYNESLDSILWQANQLVLQSQNNEDRHQYVKSLREDCSFSRADSCKVFHRFSRINNTYDILLKYVQSQTPIANAEEVILLADASAQNRSPLDLIAQIALRAETLKTDQRLIKVVKNYLALYSDQIPAVQTKKLYKYANLINGSFLNLLTKKELIEQLNTLHQQLPLNIYMKAQEIRPALTQALNLKPLAKNSIYLLLDLVQNQQLDLGDAKDVLFKVTNPELLTKHVEDFVKWNFSYQLQLTNSQAQQIIQRMSVSSNDIFGRYQREADEIRKAWSAFKYEQQRFITNLSRTTMSQALKQSLKDSISSLDHSIKLYSEYPHMFYLATFLAQQDFNRTVKIGTTSVDLSSGSVFNEILNPLRTKLSWFKYTEDFFPLNDFLVRSSLAFMIKSDFFPSMNVKTDVFLSYLIKNLNSHYSERHQRKILKVNSFIANENTYKQLDTLCHRPNAEIKVEFDELNSGFITTHFHYKTFTDPIAVMMDSYTGGETGFMPFDRETIPELYEYVRTDLAYYQRILELIDSNLKSTNRSSTVVLQSLKKIEENRNIAKSSFAKWNQIGACRLKLINEERKIISYVYEKEKKYIQQVHRDILLLRSSHGGMAQQAIQSKYAGPESYLFEELIPLNVRSLDAISTEGYLTTQFNFYSRVAHYLTTYEGALRVKVVLPPEIKKNRYYSYRDLNGNIRTVQPRFVPFHESSDEFLKYFCNTYFSNLSFTRWMTFESYALAIEPYLRGQMAQLSMGLLSIQEYIDIFKTTVEYFKIKPQEREILTNLNNRSLFDIGVFDGTFLEKNFKMGIYVKKFGLFDVTLAFLMEDVLGYDYFVTELLSREDVEKSAGEADTLRARMPLRRGPFAEAQIMHDTLRDPSVKYYLFPLDAEIIKKEYAQLKKSIFDKRDLMENFMGAVTKADLSQVQIDIFVDDVITGPLFTPYILNRYQTRQHEFDQKTRLCFLKTASCF